MPYKTVQPSRDELRRINELAGLELEPGAFYTCAVPGGWADVNTGLFFKGPKAIVDPDTREITALVDLPEPVQLPHFRMADYDSLTEAGKRRVPVDGRTPLPGRPDLVRVAFNEPTLDEFCSGLNLAIRTGTIVRVSDFDMETLHSETWAQGATDKEPIVYGRTTNERVAKPPLGELLDDLMQSRRVSLSEEAARRKAK